MMFFEMHVFTFELLISNHNQYFIYLLLIIFFFSSSSFIYIYKNHLYFPTYISIAYLHSLTIMTTRITFCSQLCWCEDVPHV